MIPEALEKIADNVLALDETDLAILLDHYKDRMSQGEPTRAWERAVIAYFLLNGIRIKTQSRKKIRTCAWSRPERRQLLFSCFLPFLSAPQERYFYLPLRNSFAFSKVKSFPSPSAVLGALKFF